MIHRTTVEANSDEKKTWLTKIYAKSQNIYKTTIHTDTAKRSYNGGESSLKDGCRLLAGPGFLGGLKLKDALRGLRVVCS